MWQYLHCSGNYGRHQMAIQGKHNTTATPTQFSTLYNHRTCRPTPTNELQYQFIAPAMFSQTLPWLTSCFLRKAWMMRSQYKHFSGLWANKFQDVISNRANSDNLRLKSKGEVFFLPGIIFTTIIQVAIYFFSVNRKTPCHPGCGLCNIIKVQFVNEISDFNLHLKLTE